MGVGFAVGCAFLAIGFVLGCDTISRISIHYDTICEIREWRRTLQKESSEWRKHLVRLMSEDPLG